MEKENLSSDFDDMSSFFKFSQWIMIFDKKCKILFCNWTEDFKKMLGYGIEDEFPNEIESFVSIIHQDDKDLLINDFWDVVYERNGAESLDVECRIKNRSGIYKWYHCFGKLVKTPGENTFQFRGILVDINENKLSKLKLESTLNERILQLDILSAVSNIFLTMHVINIKTDSFIEYTTTKNVRRWTKTINNACFQMQEVMKNVVVSEHKEKVLRFVDFNTLSERLKDCKIITEEFISVNFGWCRASFVSLDKDDKNNQISVVFITQVIDDEKRREEHLVYRSNTDELTKCYNRRCFNEHIEKYAMENKVIKDKDFVFISADINGLKDVNDELGHLAGDELIEGFAYILRKAFSPYGRIYRVGGDEFVAILSIAPSLLPRIKNNYESEIESWHGEYVDKMSASSGWVSIVEFPDASFDEIYKIADDRMYQAKAMYYASSGAERRGQQDAYMALCKSYIKVLRVDLKTEKFVVLHMDSKERSCDKNYDECISVWFNNFANNGQIYEGDIERYLKNTNLDYLRNYFSTGNTMLCIHYKRLIDGTFRRVIMEIIRSEDFKQNNQIVYLYVKNIDS